MGCNIWKFVIKPKRFKVLPLVTFYCLALTLAFERFYYSIWFFKAIYTDMNLVTALIPFNLKAMIGLNQTWTIIELCLGIKSSFSLRTNQQTAE